MTSTTSSKTNCLKQGLSVFLWTLRSSRATIIIYLAILGFFGVCTALFEYSINSFTYVHSASSGLVGISEFPTLFMMQMAITLAFVFGFVLCVQGFGYLHNKRKTDMFGSLPVSRRTLFFSKTASVFIVSAVPMLLVLLFLNIFGADLYSPLSFNTFENTAVTTIALVANIAFFGLIALCCGKTSDTIVSLIVINVAYPVSIVLLQILPGSLVYGYAADFKPDLIFALSPITAANTINIWYWLVFIAVCIALSFVLIKRRGSEAAQSHFAFKLPFVAVKLLVSFAVGIAFAYLLLAINGDGASGAECISWFWFGMILGSLIAYTVIQIILNHGVKGYFKSLIGYGIMLLSFACIFGVINGGMMGYEKYVPKAEDVKSVTLGSVKYSANGKKIYDNTTEDKDFIKEVVNSHKSIIDAHEDATMFKMLSNNVSAFVESFVSKIRNDYSSSYYHYGDMYNLDYIITYTLNNGAKIERKYMRLTESDLIEKIASKNHYVHTAPIFVCDDADCDSMEITNYRDGEATLGLYGNRKSHREIMSELFEALKKDMMADENPSESTDYMFYNFYISYDSEDDNDYYGSVDQSFDIKKSYKNTIKVLEKYDDKFEDWED